MKRRSFLRGLTCAVTAPAAAAPQMLGIKIHPQVLATADEVIE